jgi:hypothetical protein
MVGGGARVAVGCLWAGKSLRLPGWIIRGSSDPAERRTPGVVSTCGARYRGADDAKTELLYHPGGGLLHVPHLGCRGLQFVTVPGPSCDQESWFFANSDWRSVKGSGRQNTNA